MGNVVCKWYTTRLSRGLDHFPIPDITLSMLTQIVWGGIGNGWKRYNKSHRYSCNLIPCSYPTASWDGEGSMNTMFSIVFITHKIDQTVFRVNHQHRHDQLSMYMLCTGQWGNTVFEWAMPFRTNLIASMNIGASQPSLIRILLRQTMNKGFLAQIQDAQVFMDLK